MLEIGSLVDGKYKILNKIGQGGMSVVYLAMNERANKQWAIKEVRKDGVSNFEVVKQGLVAEVDMLKRLNHPHLPSIIDVIDGDDSFLIVMDYIEGVSLNKKIKELGAIPQEDVIEWGKQLCDVLGYLHSREKPIVYRDMKPSNVMLKPDGNVVLIDFGTAREFKSTSVADTTCLGTQGYAAPEQFGGQGQTDARTDIYCLGATMYHLVTGHNPCEYPYEMYPIRRWNPALSSGLEEIILRCTQKNPNDRYQSCAELMYALEHYRDLDIETRKANNLKWRSFLAAGIASLLMFAAFGVCKYISVRDAEWSYSNYISEATSYQDFDNLKSAADLYPNRLEPYTKAVEIVKKDNVFTSDESSKFTQTLIDPSSETYMNLKNTGNPFYKFCYDMGIAYLFYYETDNVGIEKCQNWFNLVKDAVPSDDDNALSQRDIENAEMLEKLSEALCKKNMINGQGTAQLEIGEEDPATGEVKYSYKTYFDVLTSILDFDFFDEANSVTKRKVYSWIYATMLQDYDKLKQSGVEVNELKNIKNRAIDDLENLISQISDKDSETYKEIEELLANYQTIGESWQ